MKTIVLSIFFLSTAVVFPLPSKAASIPCSMILEPTNINIPNAMGVALIYKVQLHPPSFERTNISILGVHLPDPSSYGTYDSYEGFAFIPEEISWRFNLYPLLEKDQTWAGKIDGITAKMENVEVQVRLSNSKTKKIGPSLLEKNIKYCK